MKVLGTKVDEATATAVITAAKAEALADKRKKVSVSHWVHGAINAKLNQALNGTQQAVPSSTDTTELLMGIAERLAAKIDTVEAKTDTVIDTVVRLLELITNPQRKKPVSPEKQAEIDKLKAMAERAEHEAWENHIRGEQPESTTPQP